MTAADIPFGLQLSQAAGWNQTAGDWALFLECGAGGSYIASYQGEAAGTVTTVGYADRRHWLGWIGMVLVAAEYRRLGIGTALLAAAIESARGRGTVCLDATPQGKPLYDRLGFVDVYPLTRWLRRAAPAPQRLPSRCIPFEDDLLPAVVEYDRPIFGVGRASVLGSFSRRAPGLAFCAETGGRLSGYCLGRYGAHSTQIGPVCADRLETAGELFLAALKTCAQQDVIVDAAAHDPGWIEFLRGLGFRELRPFMRMRRGEFPLPEQHARQFAIAGPEIG